ncbi:hypothetical protein [Fictibacillus sp. NRS-1165]|uniref:hypothetical protein n=1 Tax=Fictibacillus sp. NRS-1165 TaxID=3144463 RepID=UPI003D21FC35
MNMSIRNRVRFMLFMSLIGMLIMIGFMACYVWFSGRMDQEKEQLQQNSIQSKEIYSELTTVRKKRTRLLAASFHRKSKRDQLFSSYIAKESRKLCKERQ